MCHVRLGLLDRLEEVAHVTSSHSSPPASTCPFRHSPSIEPMWKRNIVIRCANTDQLQKRKVTLVLLCTRTGLVPHFTLIPHFSQKGGTTIERMQKYFTNYKKAISSCPSQLPVLKAHYYQNLESIISITPALVNVIC